MAFMDSTNNCSWKVRAPTSLRRLLVGIVVQDWRSSSQTRMMIASRLLIYVKVCEKLDDLVVPPWGTLIDRARAGDTI